MFLLLLILAAAVWLVVRFYNGLQRQSHDIREAHSNIIVAMKKRIDLVNKLIDIATNYADHEKLTHISIARGESDSAVISASTAAAGAIQTVMKLATQYPALRASEMYGNLMVQLEGVEETIQHRREGYNAAVKRYNTELSQIPANLIAPALGFRSAPYFNVDDADSLEGLKEFSSADGDALRAMLADTGRKMAGATRDASRRAVELGKEAVELGRDAIDKGMEAADRHRENREKE